MFKEQSGSDLFNLMLYVDRPQLRLILGQLISQIAPTAIA